MLCCSMLLDASYSILLPCTPVLVQIPTSSPTGVPTSAVSSFILYDMNAHQFTSKLILCIYYLSLLETLQPSNAPTSQPTSQPTDNPTPSPTLGPDTFTPGDLTVSCDSGNLILSTVSYIDVFQSPVLICQAISSSYF